MDKWFKSFSESYCMARVSTDLIGAGTASGEKAMDHYRYQHQTKIRECIIATFPVFTKLLGEALELTWKSFWATNPVSPRSLDHYPEVFLLYFVGTDAPVEMKDLLKFEHILDTYPFRNEEVVPCTLETLSEESKLQLSYYEIHDFDSSVIHFYETGVSETEKPTKVIFWLTSHGVQYRSMEDWELNVMDHLHHGVGTSLQYAPQNEARITDFFRWLGQSGLIKIVS